MEQRSWPRESVDIAASYTTAGLQSQACRLRDYCTGGVLLEAATDVVELLSVGDRIAILFASNATARTARVDLQGEIKRIAGQLAVQLTSGYRYAGHIQGRGDPLP